MMNVEHAVIDTTYDLLTDSENSAILKNIAFVEAVACGGGRADKLVLSGTDDDEEPEPEGIDDLEDALIRWGSEGGQNLD
jgi:hypothetical protein